MLYIYFEDKASTSQTFAADMTTARKIPTHTILNQRRRGEVNAAEKLRCNTHKRKVWYVSRWWFRSKWAFV